jgi:5'-nucleotidase
MRILITNDDGVNAPGIKNLIEAVKDFGEILVVAPDSPQSGMGHAISINRPLRMEKLDLFDHWNVTTYQCSGTPVDCVKLAIDVLLKGEKPDICLSGINHGSNASINVIYSGTMSAAMEAAVAGVPSIGFSSLDFNFDADFTVAQSVVRQLVTKIIQDEMPEHFLLNVNIPKVKVEEFKGIRICRQADAHWTENFIQRQDPRGKDYYWMVGKFVNRDKGEDTDVEALKLGYASVVPIRIDLTEDATKQWLENKWTDLN